MQEGKKLFTYVKFFHCPASAGRCMEGAFRLAPHYEPQSIQLKLDSTVEAEFLGDPEQLKQVLINLIQNAAEAIGQNGAITLRARAENRRLKGCPADVVIIEVQDTGPGIPTEVGERLRLFDPFFSTKGKAVRAFHNQCPNKPHHGSVKQKTRNPMRLNIQSDIARHHRHNIACKNRSPGAYKPSEIHTNT